MSFKNIEETLKLFMSDVFLETGTYKGETCRIAKLLGFKKVITIELQEYLYDDILNNRVEGIDYYLGDSPKIMEEILPNIDGKITFWLDGHIDGGNYVRGLTPNIRPCPLYEELECIKKLKRNDHTILIDDLRIIGNVGWGLNIKYEELIKKLKEINNNYNINTIDGTAKDDILVAKI